MNTTSIVIVGVTAIIASSLSASAVHQTSVGSVGASSPSLTLAHPMPTSVYIQPETFGVPGWQITMLPAGYDSVDSSVGGVVLMREHEEPFIFWRWTSGHMERLGRTSEAYINNGGEIGLGNYYNGSPAGMYFLAKTWPPSSKSFDFSWQNPVESRRYIDNDTGVPYDYWFSQAQLLRLDNAGKLWVRRTVPPAVGWDGSSLETIDRYGRRQRQFLGYYDYMLGGGISKGGHWYYNTGYWSSIIDGVEVPDLAPTSISTNGIALLSYDPVSVIRYTDGTIDEGPYGQNPNWNVKWIDDQDRLMGRRIDDTGRAIACVFTKKKDPNGAAILPMEYEYTDFVPLVLSNGWTTDHVIAPGTISPQLGIARRTQADGSIEERAFLALRAPELAVDADRDGTIKLASEEAPDATSTDATSAEKPYRFWLNDDDDSGDVANNDTPIITSGNNGPADYQGSGTYFGVDGTCDLIDFFPVYLDIRQLLTVLPPTSSGIQYKLKQADSALNFVYTNLTRAEAFHYLKHNRDRQAYGTPGSETYARQAPTVWITAEGALLNADFLARIKNEADKGVILVEGRMAIDKPLRLVVEKAGVEIAEVALHLKISPVEDMYRWINLRGVSGQTEMRATNVNQPPAYPDALTNGKMFVWVHGYNVNEQQSRGWNAEAFKRLWHSGSKAMFTAVTWHGDHSQITVPIVDIYAAPDYWDNIPNAFLTAEALAPLVNALPGSSKVIAGHSMGNIVVSSAIKEHGLNVAKYLMVDAAVALEAYDTSVSTVGPYYVNAMRPLGWTDFERRLWSTDWWRLFPEEDNRRRLTWMNRFGNIPQAINVYSSGEDVLNNNDLTPGEPPYGPHIWQVGAERSWIQQEMVKGTLDKVSLIAWEIQGGWGLNSFWDNKEWVPDDSDAGGYFRRWPKTPAEAAVISDAELRAWPYFERFNKSSLMNADVGAGSSGSNATDASAIADLLGGAIPALSFPAGRNAVPVFTTGRNRDLMTFQDGWPAVRSNNRWRHSDIRNVAYFFNYGAWDLFTTEGNLR